MKTNPHSESHRYYDDQAERFYSASVGADMSEHYARFLAHVPAGGRILDAGCGSGRDSRAFLDRGYDIVACDASARMVELSFALVGRPTMHLRFQDLAFAEEFDGVWACASLLHVPRFEINDVLTRLVRALRIGGVLFLSVKYGEHEEQRNGRWFNDYTEHSMRELLTSQPNLQLVDLWVSGDVRPERGGEQWLDVIARRAS